MIQPPGTITGVPPGARQRAPACHGLILSLLMLLVLPGCGQQPVSRADVDALPPLQVNGELIRVADVGASAPTPDLLRVTGEMRRFVDRYALTSPNFHQRLINLHSAVKGAGMLDLQYDPFADGTASEVYARGSANCLSYAHLFIALAREAGLDAQYHQLEVRPQWTRMGERVALRLHVNVVVRLPRGEQYMVDIDPLPSREIAGTATISDADAAALYHSNIAMDALADGDSSTAWRQAVRALQLSPGMAHLWVNLGAIYRAAGQHGAAEQSYFRALAIDSDDRSAMNNLVVLYSEDGREAEHAYWVERVERHRDANPYYHAWLGDTAAEQGDWDGALGHYRRAVELHPRDSRLVYALGIIEYQRGEFEAATELIGQAIELATLRGDIDSYRVQLEVVRREATAGR